MRSRELAIFDLDLSSIIRRPLRLVPPTERSKVTYFYLNKNFKLSKAMETGFNIKKLTHVSQLKNYDVIIRGYRFPEMLILNSDQVLGNIYYMQAGINPVFMSRNWISLFGKVGRLIQYIKFGLRNFLYIKSNLISSFFKVWIMDKDLESGELTQPFKILLFDSRSLNFYRKRLAWNCKDSIYPWYEPKRIMKDLVDVDTDRFEQYVCQSLVEDGRVSKNSLHKSLNEILESIDSKKKLMLILHPNSNRDLYLSHNLNNRFIFNDSEIIYPVKTHGHYSNLLIYIKQNGLEVKIWHIQNHKIPLNFMDLLQETKEASLPYTNNICDENFISYLKNEEAYDM